MFLFQKSVIFSNFYGPAIRIIVYQQASEQLSQTSSAPRRFDSIFFRHRAHFSVIERLASVIKSDYRLFLDQLLISQNDSNHFVSWFIMISNF